MKDFSIQDVCSLLREINLEQYEDMFEQKQIDGGLLEDLNEDVLINDFKMPSFHAMKSKKAVMNNWRPLIIPSPDIKRHDTCQKFNLKSQFLDEHYNIKKDVHKKFKSISWICGNYGTVKKTKLYHILICISQLMVMKEGPMKI
ncbi:uncharacterized protein LOC124437107 [Xenia sp. Carnegie-2017]|nr:uncharacterized protein LOC124437107 [Xenia sp. Carnegie-2017]